MRSSSWRWPLAMISALMCERRSNVTGSIVWYSSSMPIEKEGFMRLAVDSWRLAVASTSQELAPTIGGRRCRLGRLLHREIGDGVDDPVEVGAADRMQIGVWCRVHEVNRIGDAVFDSEFHRIQVVAKRTAEQQRIALHP